ncbi:hypothetical protein [Methylococcus sp. EFPC2]|uniref:hypothetical protein n=1 Tax=Methylococcus sp. EFPC2 TaxID=2812648 RepID=UPI00196773AB|nr:hypothetical protein [Methylococcus sp. EFPC2]QSA98672.1 hypothetical protein JWZ97_07750 [Methylococcus sp. EFPC2]
MITGMDLREHFRASVATAIANQRVEAEEETVFYIVNMLAHFTRADRLFDRTDDGLVIQPLAALYARALQAPSQEDRYRTLKRLGDIALLISGLFSDSLNRKVVDVDYYIAMGRGAYAHLCGSGREFMHLRALRAIFTELSAKFQVFVDVLSEVGEQSGLGASNDLMRLYELWSRTGSVRAAAKLRRLGVEPVGNPLGRWRN